MRLFESSATRRKNASSQSGRKQRPRDARGRTPSPTKKSNRARKAHASNLSDDRNPASPTQYESRERGSRSKSRGREELRSRSRSQDIRASRSKSRQRARSKSRETRENHYDAKSIKTCKLKISPRKGRNKSRSRSTNLNISPSEEQLMKKYLFDEMQQPLALVPTNTDKKTNTSKNFMSQLLLTVGGQVHEVVESAIEVASKQIEKIKSENGPITGLNCTSCNAMPFFLKQEKYPLPLNDRDISPSDLKNLVDNLLNKNEELEMKLEHLKTRSPHDHEGKNVHFSSCLETASPRTQELFQKFQSNHPLMKPDNTSTRVLDERLSMHELDTSLRNINLNDSGEVLTNFARIQLPISNDSSRSRERSRHNDREHRRVRSFSETRSTRCSGREDKKKRKTNRSRSQPPKGSHRQTQSLSSLSWWKTKREDPLSPRKSGKRR